MWGVADAGRVGARAVTHPPIPPPMIEVRKGWWTWRERRVPAEQLARENAAAELERPTSRSRIARRILNIMTFAAIVVLSVIASLALHGAITLHDIAQRAGGGMPFMHRFSFWHGFALGAAGVALTIGAVALILQKEP